MDRRKALINMGLLTGGVMLFPSCDFSEEKVSLTLNKLSITESQEALMKKLVATILPEGNIQGASSINLQDFVWIMVDDCMEEASQKSYINGLQNFNDRFEEIAGKSFESLDQEGRVEVLGNLLKGRENGAGPEELDLINFLETTKQFSIWGYMTSEYIMTEVMPYTLIPGTYGPCETIDKSKRINLYG